MNTYTIHMSWLLLKVCIRKICSFFDTSWALQDAFNGIFRELDCNYLSDLYLMVKSDASLSKIKEADKKQGNVPKRVRGERQ